MKYANSKALSIFFCIICFGCKSKKNNTIAEITYIGIPRVGQLLTFHYPVPSGIQCLWKFGDGAT